MISIPLSPAKPLNLYIDDDRNYCIAIFEDEELEMAIGRRGVNVNLASKVTGYKIDAFGKEEYDRKQAEQETLLSDLDNFPKRSIKPLEENDINTISDLMNSDEEKLVEIKGITEKSLEKMYDSIQSFIEKNQESLDEVAVEEAKEESVTDEPNVDEVAVEEENEEPSANKDDIDSIEDSEKVEV